MWRTLLTGYQYVLLVYFSLLNILYALFSCIGLRAIVVVFAREFSQGSLRDLLERDVYKPVSILVPAHNEEVSIVGFRGPPADRYPLTPVPTGRQTMRRATAVLVLAAMLAIGGPAVSGAAAHESHSRYWKVRVPPSMAVYESHNAGDLAPAEVHLRLRFLRANGFRTIYLDIGKYFDAADASNQTLVRTLRGQIRRFVATAAGYGLSVQALGGGPNWFGPIYGYLGPTLVDLVANYNSHVDQRERLAGVHLDLEPYTEDSWRDPANVRANAGLYLTTIAEIVGAYRAALGTRGNRNLQLGLAIPFWFDGSSEEVPDDIDFRTTTTPTPSRSPSTSSTWSPTCPAPTW